MIDLYTWSTPNGRKVSILLEELGIEYTVYPIDIGKGDQFSKKFQKIFPDYKIPVIYDNQDQRFIRESGAILLYLSNKFGQFTGTADYHWDVMQWLMWQMSAIGPILGQAHHFLYYNKGRSAYAEDRFKNEAKKLYGILDNRLKNFEYISGPGKGEYSIADISLWPWISRFQRHQINLDEYPNVYQWYRKISERPAVIKGYDIPLFGNKIPT